MFIWFSFLFFFFFVTIQTYTLPLLCVHLYIIKPGSVRVYIMWQWKKYLKKTVRPLNARNFIIIIIFTRLIWKKTENKKKKLRLRRRRITRFDDDDDDACHLPAATSSRGDVCAPITSSSLSWSSQQRRVWARLFCGCASLCFSPGISFFISKCFCYFHSFGILHFTRFVFSDNWRLWRCDEVSVLA